MFIQKFANLWIPDECIRENALKFVLFTASMARYYKETETLLSE